MRDRFPVFLHQKELHYFDSAATTHKPKEVIEAIRRAYEEEYATVHRAVYPSSLTMTESYQAARQEIAQFCGAEESEIVFTRGTTDAINLVALSLSQGFFREGDEILLSSLEHHSNLVPWQMVAEKTGAILRWMPASKTGEILYEGQITPKTKLIAIAHMSNVTGKIHPIQALAQEAKKVGALLLVDGAQAAAHLSVDVKKLGCDFYAFSAHKCYGPTGLGILFGKEEQLKKMPPVVGGGDMIERVTKEKTTYLAPPMRFEAGTPPIAQVIGFREAIRFMQEPVVQKKIQEEDALKELAFHRLNQIKGISFLGEPLQNSGPLLTLNIKGVHPLDLGSLLGARGFACRTGHLCSQLAMQHFGVEHALRISFGLYNDEHETNQLLDAIESLISLLA